MTYEEQRKIVQKRHTGEARALKLAAINRNRDAEYRRRVKKARERGFSKEHAHLLAQRRRKVTGIEQ